ncbi:MAG: hypothetical protein JRI37_15635, partial [Deltaproteobacteria bacterium]|nr:hypothetical protein [Deltaproteobacteria bacterium]
MTMTRFLKIILFFFFAVFLASTNAHATNILDSYVGADHHGHGDVIGSQALFDISQAKVNLVGTTLTVDIYTGFAGEGDEGHFSAYTKSGNGRGNGIGYGDLFLASAWSPYGSAPYVHDDHRNGTTWTYALALDNRWWNGTDSTGGNATLYSLNSGDNNADALLSDDFITGGATYRNGQEVAVDTSSQTVTDLS